MQQAKQGKPTKRKDGRWQVWLTLPGGARKAVYGRSRAEAQSKAQGRLEALTAAPSLDVSLRLRAWCTTWLAQTDVRANTQQSYRQILDTHLGPLGERRLYEVTPADIQQWVGRLQDKGLSPTTVRYAHTVLRKALADAERLELLPRNPAARTLLPKASKPDVQILSRDEARRLLDAAGEHKPLFALALGCGLRISEVLALRHDSVQGDTLHVTQSVKYVGTQAIVGLPKTSRSIRSLPIPAFVVPLLPTPSEGYLFGGEEPLSRWVVYAAWKRACRQAGVQTKFHALRHTYASWLLEAGVPVIKVSRLLGHASIATTADIYGTIDTALVDITAVCLL